MSWIPFVYGIDCLAAAIYFGLKGQRAKAENNELCAIGYLILSYVMERGA